MVNQISDFRQTGGSAGTENWRPLFALRDSNYIERFEPAEPYKPLEAIRLDRKSTRRAGRARGNAAS
jgi:hypothetical protein